MDHATRNSTCVLQIIKTSLCRRNIRTRSALMSQHLPFIRPSKVVPSGIPAPESRQQQSIWRNLLSWLLYFLFGIILPDGSFRATWDLIIAGLLAFISVVLPFTIAFNNDFQWSSDCPERWPGVEFSTTETVSLRISPMQAVMYAIDGIFAVDILINFRTAFIDDECRFVTSHRAIASQYVRSWFVLDFVSIFPFDAVLASPKLGIFNLFKSTRLIKLAKVMRFLRIMKMLKLLRLPRIFSTLRAVVGKAFISMVMLFLGILMAYNDCKPNWITNAGLLVGDHYHTYITALYWALSTMTTVGYGDVVPGSPMEQIASMVGMGIGVSLFSYLIGSLVSMLAAMQKESSFVAAHKEKLEQFITTRKIAMGLAFRMRTYYNYALIHIADNENFPLIMGLSYSLRCVMQLGTPVLTERRAFWQSLIAQILSFGQLVSIMVLEFFAPEDVIIKQGSFSDALYIMVEGPKGAAECRRYKTAHNTRLKTPHFARSTGKRRMDSTDSSSIGGAAAKALGGANTSMEQADEIEYTVVTEIGPKQAFGEHEFFTGKASWASVVALACCQAQVMKVGPFCRVLHAWPEIRQDVMVYAMRLSRVAENEVEQQEKDKNQDRLHRNDTWQEEAYGDEFDPREQEFRL